ncbi:LOW QUALITY PROTEIN: abscisate beta-glucosyltransferase [Eucalyptus grandis]|uniref:LOW QUALITY PROTEIN: abscisate beta-glucosyltransferase n=1 Tax=Eucalyptus grandis TaxID=71139 RepID=UPI00192EEA63|nr:LOW QUALITY PROTEIN: abscisate beta-glucosyltransferase [Eucalyptus grandis]
MADEVEMFFFPSVGGDDQIPMIDIACLFASHGVKSTIVATPNKALSFQRSIARNQDSGRPISIHPLDLPPGSELPDADMSASPFTDTCMLQESLKLLLIARRPDCIVVDTFHGWSADVIDEVGFPRIVFIGNGCFSRCAQEPESMVESEYDPFELPGRPKEIKMTRSQLCIFTSVQEAGKPPGGMWTSEDRSLGFLVNSFLDLEPACAEYFKKEMVKKAWVVGPVSLRIAEDMGERGQRAAIDEQSCLNWLNAKEPNSVLYVSFGSLARLTPEQLLKIAYGLEASSCSFIWAAGKILESSENGEGGREDWLPSGFEERLKESERGLIIRGWVPQLLILEHPSVGGYMTLCDWNSILEGVSAGVPMATLPRSAEQLLNGKLVVDVLKIGVQADSMEWTSWNTEPGPAVDPEKVEAAVRKLMDGGEEAAEMRRRAEDLGGKARKAVGEGGSSYGDVEALIQELKNRKNVRDCTAQMYNRPAASNPFSGLNHRHSRFTHIHAGKSPPFTLPTSSTGCAAAGAAFEHSGATSARGSRLTSYPSPSPPLSGVSPPPTYRPIRAAAVNLPPGSLHFQQ